MNKEVKEIEKMIQRLIDNFSNPNNSSFLDGWFQCLIELKKQINLIYQYEEEVNQNK
jgi:hypothetical protein